MGTRRSSPTFPRCSRCLRSGRGAGRAARFRRRLFARKPSSSPPPCPAAPGPARRYGRVSSGARRLPATPVALFWDQSSHLLLLNASDVRPCAARPDKVKIRLRAARGAAAGRTRSGEEMGTRRSSPTFPRCSQCLQLGRGAGGTARFRRRLLARKPSSSPPPCPAAPGPARRYGRVSSCSWSPRAFGTGPWCSHLLLLNTSDVRPCAARPDKVKIVYSAQTASLVCTLRDRVPTG